MSRRRPDRGILPVTLALAALAAGGGLGCAEGPRTAPAEACDPLRADDCPGDAVCAVTAEGPRCRPPAEAPADRACAAASCPPGRACTVVEGLLGCRPLCAPSDPEGFPCPEGPLCDYRLSALDLGVCPARCAPGDDCGPGATCGLSPTLPHPICVALGPAGAGEPCAEVRCAAGLACLEVGDPPAERCTPLCDPTAPACPVGACAGRIVGVEGAGYCTEDG